jgi:hypothetical protein
MRFMRVFIILLVSSLAVFVAADLVQPRENVTVSVQGLDAAYHYRDALTQAAIVAIDNPGPHPLDFEVALQIKQTAGWEPPADVKSFVMDLEPSVLRPFGKRIFHLPVPVTPIPQPWRVLVICDRGRFNKDLSKWEKFHLETRSWLLSNPDYHYYFTSREIPPATVLQPASTLH